MADDITVRGGVAGTQVALDDLTAAGERLLLEGARVGVLAPRVLRAAVDPAVLLAAVGEADDLVDLVTGRRVGLDPGLLGLVSDIETGALRAGGPTGLLGVGLELGSLGARLGVVVAAYRVADAAAQRAVVALQDELMEVVGILTPGLVLAGGVAELVGADVPGALDRLAFEHPGIVDTAAGGVDGYLRGLARQPAFAVVLALGAARSRTPWPPADEQAAVRILGGVAGLAGALDEDGAWGSSGLDVRVGDAVETGGPTGLAGLMVDEVDLGRDDEECRVRVVEVPQPDGSSAWILELPGTQAWDPRPGANPFDLTTDVEAMAGEATMAAAGAAGVLAAAQSRRGRLGAGDPVMLVGHSQGGILAASLASDPRFRAAQRVTDVVTFGAPVSHFPVPAGVRVLSVEHQQDPVPRLDGGRNPDRADWVTVERDLAGRAGGRSAALTHRASEYLDTAELIDGRLAAGTADPSLRDWAAHSSAYFRPEARVTDAHLTRPPRPTQ